MLATNLTELIGRERLCRLLRLCGADEALLAQGSEHDLFLAFCRALPLLEGHPFPASLQRFLETRLAISLPLAPDHADEIWLAVAQTLLMHPTALPVTMEVQLPEKRPLPPLKPLPNARAWRHDGSIETDAASWQAWERELRETLDEKERAGVSFVSFVISDAVLAQRPNPYRVDLTLKASLRTEEDRALLQAQCVRFFCVEAQRRGLTLILQFDADRRSPIDFLEWLEQTAGLPSLLTVVSGRLFDPLLDFAARAHRAPVGLAVDLAHHTDRAAFEREVGRLAEHYPAGCLSVLDGDRLCRFEK